MRIAVPLLACTLTACAGWHGQPYVGLGYVDDSDISMRNDRVPERTESGSIDGRVFGFLMWEPKRGLERDWPYWGNVPFYPAHMPQPAENGPTEPEVDPEIEGTDSGEPESQALVRKVLDAVPDSDTGMWGLGILLASIGVGVIVWGVRGFPGIRRKA
jgi:hypothetical protein